MAETSRKKGLRISERRKSRRATGKLQSVQNLTLPRMRTKRRVKLDSACAREPVGPGNQVAALTRGTALHINFNSRKGTGGGGGAAPTTYIVRGHHLILFTMVEK